MAGASFVQTNFQGGEWAPAARGRMEEPAYKTAMQACLNGFPLRNRAWTRRPGFQFMSWTKNGKPGRLRAFAYNTSAPFEAELTDGWLRIHAGILPVATTDQVTLASISTANPAVVTVNGTLPASWKAGDTIQFRFSLPMSAPILAGRQFTISAVGTSSFTIYDALTGAGIDGSTFTYTPNATGARDFIAKIAEFATPYQNGEWQDVRFLQNDTVVLLLHGRHQPQALTLNNGSFSLVPQAFSDGPYFDINTTATTLTPSAVSGSVTITASSTTGINSGRGFVPTDVGRMIRLQSGPPAWASGTAYSKGATVLGSDNNIYVAQAASTGANPTTDNGTNWLLSGATVVWSWATITAWTSATAVTATINGATLSSTAATTSWQLGLYSDTTGWPTSGAYHEGRFWLANAIVPNRIDASMSNNVFTFSPSGADGTVADNNGLALVANASDQNQVFWLLTSQEGILAGTISGEWLIRASQFGDPITPTSVQIRRVSTYGCANIEPEITARTTTFVQRQARKLLDFSHYPYGETSGWFADDLSLLANHLTGPAIAEMRWQQEPNHTVWLRKTDGTLAGTVFQHGPSGFQNANIYNGWFRALLGGNRTVESIATGPTVNGISTTVYIVALNAATGYREMLALDSIPDDGSPSWNSFYVDGVVPASAVQQLSVATGDPIDGIRLLGLQNVNGQTVTPVLAGLDLGDFTVASGKVDIPYSGAFTSAFFSGLNNGTDYGAHAVPVMPPFTAPGLAVNTFGAYAPTTTNLVGTTPNQPFLDEGNNWLIVPQSDGMRLYNATTFDEIINSTAAQIFGPASTLFINAGPQTYHPALRAIFGHVSGGNSAIFGRIAVSKTGFVLTGTLGASTSDLGNSGPAHIASGNNSLIPLSFNGTNYVGHVGITGVSTANEVALLDADAMAFVAATTLTDAEAWLCPARPSVPSFYALGTPNYGVAQTTAVHLYRFDVSAPSSLVKSPVPVASGSFDGLGAGGNGGRPPKLGIIFQKF